MTIRNWYLDRVLDLAGRKGETMTTQDWHFTVPERKYRLKVVSHPRGPAYNVVHVFFDPPGAALDVTTLVATWNPVRGLDTSQSTGTIPVQDHVALADMCAVAYLQEDHE